jgi:YVTN family beta-propeller protein
VSHYSSPIGFFDSASQTSYATLNAGNSNEGIAIQGTLGVVANYFDSQITLFDTSIPQVINTIPVGSNPKGVAIKGSLCAIANHASDNITLLNTETQTIVGTITLAPGSRPYGVALNGNMGVVSNRVANSITFFNTVTKQVLETLPVGTYPLGIAMNEIFGAVANGEDDTVTIFDTKKRKIFGTVNVGDYPLGIAINGTLCAVCNGNSNDVTLFSVDIPLAKLSTAGGDNSAVSATVLNNVNGNCPKPTQDIIDYLLGLPESEQIRDLDEMTPEFKIMQFGQEKLDLLLHKQLESTLYINDNSTLVYLLAGYDHVKQKQNKLYNGYRINNFYQMLAISHGWDEYRALAGIGAAESYLNLNNGIGYANYPAVYGTLGIKRDLNRWQIGLKGLYGYSFLNTHRNIDFLNLKSKSHHGAWTLSFDGKISYSVVHNNTNITPYNSLSYLYGKENSYTESGAPGANFYVKDEKISVIRNLLGIALEMPYGSQVKFFIDGAWLYEDYLNDQGYKAAFLGTDVYGEYHQIVPTKNYGRIETGISGSYQKFDWKISYLGLFGSSYSENSLNGKLGIKF